jgi:hypothetical protein
MVFPGFGKCTGKTGIPRNCALIPPRGIGITLQDGISAISTIPPKVIPMAIFVNKTLISLIFRPVNQSVINKAGITLERYPSWG